MGIYGHKFDKLLEASSNKYTFKGIEVEVHNDHKDDKKNNIDSDLKILNKNWNLVMDETAKDHMDFAKQYDHGKNQLSKKYTNSIDSNKKALKLYSIRYFGDCDFVLNFKSDMLTENNTDSEVECGIAKDSKKFEVFYITHND